MANWKYTLDIKESWGQAIDGKINATELSKVVADKLKMLPIFNKDMELQDIHTEFMILANDPTATLDEFDAVFNDLYDWGDQEIVSYGQWPSNKLCWIKTTF